MSQYTESLYALVNSNRFIRCFYGQCPKCGKQIFSIDDDSVKDKIKAKFICECGKKWKETVYSVELGKYKYRQALVEQYKDPKKGMINVLKMGQDIYLVKPEKILHKRLKKKGENRAEK